MVARETTLLAHELSMDSDRQLALQELGLLNIIRSSFACLAGEHFLHKQRRRVGLQCYDAADLKRCAHPEKPGA
jgi:hypothetical protein